MSPEAIADLANALRKNALDAKSSIDRRRQQNRYLDSKDSQTARRLVKEYDSLMRDKLAPMTRYINRTQQEGQSVPPLLQEDMETLSDEFASLRERARALKISPRITRPTASASLSGTSEVIPRFPYDSVFDDIPSPRNPKHRYFVEQTKPNALREEFARRKLARAERAADKWLYAPRTPRSKSAARAARPDFVRGSGGELIMLGTDSDTDED